METIKSGKNMFMDNTSRLLAKVLDFRAARQNVIAGNLANAETPGYVMKELDFEKELQKVIDNKITNPVKSEPDQVNASEAIMEDSFDPNQMIKEYGKPNELNVDKEMAKMSQNNLLYEVSTRLLSKKFENLKAVIESRR
jgi:flagellar basal-body rod protein FlgB